jgi:hypothetical protein
MLTRVRNRGIQDAVVAGLLVDGNNMSKTCQLTFKAYFY